MNNVSLGLCKVCGGGVWYRLYVQNVNLNEADGGGNTFVSTTCLKNTKSFLKVASLVHQSVLFHGKDYASLRRGRSL